MDRRSKTMETEEAELDRLLESDECMAELYRILRAMSAPTVEAEPQKTPAKPLAWTAEENDELDRQIDALVKEYHSIPVASADSLPDLEQVADLRMESEPDLLFDAVLEAESTSEVAPAAEAQAATSAEEEGDADMMKRLEEYIYQETETTECDFEREDDEEQIEVDVHFIETSLREKKLLNRHKVLMVRVGYNTETDDNYFLECIKLVESRTRTVKIILHNANRYRDVFNRLSEKLHFVWNWFPNSIFGYFRTPLYWTRTILTALSSYCYTRNFKTTIIFVDAHPVAIPLLKILYKCPVVSFAYFQELLPRSKCSIMQPRNQLRQAIPNYCLRKSNEILVPSFTAGKKYLLQIRNWKYYPIVYYPPVSKTTFMGERYTSLTNLLDVDNEDDIYILVIAPWENKENFHLGLVCLDHFYSNLIDDESHKNRLIFVIIGFMEDGDPKAISYRNEIFNMINTLPYGFREHLRVRTNPSASKMAFFYRNCLAILNLSNNDDFTWCVIESQYYGRPILSLKSPFGKEVIQHGYNGFVMDVSPIKLSKYLHRIYLQDADKFGKNSSKTYAKYYSRIERSKIIKRALLKYAPRND